MAIRFSFSVLLALPCLLGLWLFASPGVFPTLVTFLLGSVLLAGDITHLYDSFGVARYQGYLLVLRWGSYGGLLLVGFRLPAGLTPATLVGVAYGLSTALYIGAQWLTAQLFVPRREALRFSFDHRMLKAAQPFFVSNIAANVYVRSDVLLLGLLRSTREVGFYTAAYQIIFAVWGMMTLFHRAQFPITCRRAKDPKAFGDWVQRMLNVGLASTLPLCLAGIVWAPDVIRLLYGAAYVEAVLPFRILLGQLVFVGGFFIFRHALIALGSDGLYRNAAVFGAALNLLPNLAVIPWQGMIGAASTTVLAELGTLVATLRWLPRALLRDSRPLIGRHLLAAATCAGAIAVTHELGVARGVELLLMVVYATWAALAVLYPRVLYTPAGVPTSP